VYVIRFDPCITINHGKMAHLLTDGYKIAEHKVVKLWIQKKGDHSNNKSEYIQNSDGYVQIYFYVIKNLVFPCRFRL
jgi:hypothetical protein